MESKQLYFKVDGEWVTQFARDWFWLENKPYNICEELLLDCLGTDEIDLDQKKKLAQEIIEGRKKLVGTNVFTLEDDNEYVRPISEKYQEIERKRKIAELKNHMTNHMINFVDPYCTVKSLKAAREFNVETIDQCRTWFWYHDHAIQLGFMRPWEPGDGMILRDNDSTDAGLWLYDHPDVAYDAMAVHDSNPDKEYERDTFWKDLYELIKDDKRFALKDFQRRNQNYLASERVKKEKEKREQRFLSGVTIQESENPRNREYDEQIAKTIEFTDKYLETHEKPENDDDAKLSLQYHTMEFINDHLKSEETWIDKRDRMYFILPDDYEEWEGLIAPNGDFYSCAFGGHNAKAYHIICAYPDKFPNIDFDEFGKSGNMTNALDWILDQGWMATRYLPSLGAFLELPTKGRVTKAQENAVFDTKIKHDVQVNLSAIGY